jgi:hypothetical protein
LSNGLTSIGALSAFGHYLLSVRKPSIEPESNPLQKF